MKVRFGSVGEGIKRHEAGRNNWIGVEEMLYLLQQLFINDWRVFESV